MLKATPLANAFAGLTAVVYLLCISLAIVAPDLLRSIAQTWFHGFDYSSLPVVKVTAGSFVLGFVTSVVGSWIAGYLLAIMYSKFAGK